MNKQHQHLTSYLLNRCLSDRGERSRHKLALNQLIASMTRVFTVAAPRATGRCPHRDLHGDPATVALYAPTYDKKLKRMLEQHYGDPNFSTALLRKDLALFLQEAMHSGLNPEGLSGLSTLLAHDTARDLDELDYCSLHELTQSIRT